MCNLHVLYLYVLPSRYLFWFFNFNSLLVSSHLPLVHHYHLSIHSQLQSLLGTGLFLLKIPNSLIRSANNTTPRIYNFLSLLACSLCFYKCAPFSNTYLIIHNFTCIFFNVQYGMTMQITSIILDLIVICQESHTLLLLKILYAFSSISFIRFKHFNAAPDLNILIIVLHIHPNNLFCPFFLHNIYHYHLE